MIQLNIVGRAEFKPWSWTWFICNFATAAVFMFWQIGWPSPLLDPIILCCTSAVLLGSKLPSSPWQVLPRTAFWRTVQTVCIWKEAWKRSNSLLQRAVVLSWLFLHAKLAKKKLVEQMSTLTRYLIFFYFHFLFVVGSVGSTYFFVSSGYVCMMKKKPCFL